MTLSSSDARATLKADLLELVAQLPHLEHGKWIEQALISILAVAGEEIDRLDWKILTASLQDMERAFQIFSTYRHVRKISIFGSARLPAHAPEYQIALEFAGKVAQQGFMVMTGGGGGIMQAGNEGAGLEHSFGLNIQLPFEQGSNPFVTEDKLIEFKYFFTRKLFFLRETDAVALFPGGFGTQDEAFECLTLCQTGKSGPMPLVLLDKPGGQYWYGWEKYLRDHLLSQRLINGEDLSLYTITDKVDVACQAIAQFYRIYHSSRYVREQFVIRLNTELSDTEVEQLNQEFSDILVSGQIKKTKALPEERLNDVHHLPRLVLHFNQRDHGRLYQMINRMNQMGQPSEEENHPERK
ncbi:MULTISPECIES: LOG family protein [unclassified Roseofilum]|uniref:LOG family protein n=1 Tax=unclassified Roseofilum TaxID=2620099 RepID=UPI000E8AB5A4|nr:MULTISPECIES: LOG family protein [unclassified Roseofilum]MBP0009281.1 LOG family protein [Roseofilum sp. Belize Diploria]MBP0032939.1 LOG family protein [Roseofilum sp. Belize BBD 4]HBQ99860.1 cytochrome D ubiquinol oxidase subunit II [Cyanobacteria bacterium UBA11691]